MAKIPGKGSLLKITISASLTTIPQTTNITIGAQDPIMYEVNTLDGNAAVEKQHTGYFNQGDVTGEFFYDPDNAVHQFLATNSQTPFFTAIASSVVFTDATPASATFNTAGIGLGPVNIVMTDGVKCTVTLKTAGAVTLPIA